MDSLKKKTDTTNDTPDPHTTEACQKSTIKAKGEGLQQTATERERETETTTC